MSNLRVNSLSARAGTGTINVPSGNVLYAPGHIIQVVNTTLYTPTAVSIPAGGAVNTNIPDLNCGITPKSSSSKVLVQVRWFGELSNQTFNWDTMFGLKRNGVVVGLNPNTAGGGASGISMAALSYYAADGNSTPEMMSFDFHDSPATTGLVTYQVYANCVSAMTLYTNRTVSAGATSFEYGSSTITLWEIAQ